VDSGLFGSLIADLDGIYDPAQYNDRLFLGLKGTMSEAELHIIKQRMHEGKLNKARRGELGLPLPIGYHRRPSGEVVLDPDEQAEGVVRLIFDQFERLRTLDGVLRYLVSHGILIPVRSRSGPSKGELEWHRPNRPTLYNLFRNPLYAGAYVYGRRPTDPRKKQAGRSGTGRVTASPDAWHVIIRDIRPAYISWAQFESNVAQMSNNCNRSGSIGVSRNGEALLAGLVWCGRCGQRMSVQYGGKRQRHAYHCSSERSNYGGAGCQSLSGTCVDQVVANSALLALQPAILEVSLRVAQDLEAQQERLESHWRLQLERARYEAERAERQYQAEEPENRLVTRMLARALEDKLSAELKLQEEYARFRACTPRLITAEQREGILALASDIPSLWHAPTTTNLQRSDIVRLLVDRVIVAVQGSTEKVGVCIVWAGGHKTHLEATRPVASVMQLSYAKQLLQRAKELHDEGANSPLIAEKLNQEGWKPAKRAEAFTANSIRSLLSRNGLTTAKRYSKGKEPRLKRNEWWLPQLATHLEMPVETLYRWLRNGWLNSKQLAGKQGRLIVWANPGEIDRLRRLRRRKKMWSDVDHPDTKPGPRPGK